MYMMFGFCEVCFLSEHEKTANNKNDATKKFTKQQRKTVLHTSIICGIFSTLLAGIILFSDIRDQIKNNGRVDL